MRVGVLNMLLVGWPPMHDQVIKVAVCARPNVQPLTLKERTPLSYRQLPSFPRFGRHGLQTSQCSHIFRRIDFVFKISVCAQKACRQA
jgi:hypothetical protein